jgi:hypothetical protein
VHVVSTYAALTLAALFGAIGLVHLAGPRFLRDAYERWEYSQTLRVIVGFLEIVAAMLLADPRLRLWGIGLAALINFGAVITLLNHGQYLQAGPGLLVMAALLTSTLAVPVTHHPVRILVTTPAFASGQPIAPGRAPLAEGTLENVRYDPGPQPAGR